MAISITQLEVGPMQNLCYLLWDEKSKDGYLVDPAWEPETILRALKKERIAAQGILLTHSHYDHTNAIEELLKTINVPVFAHEEEIAFAQEGHDIVGHLGPNVKPTKEGDALSLGEGKIFFFHTPGHSPGSQCIQAGNYLLTGDTLFIGGCGRSDLPGGHAGTLLKSLRKISQFPQLWEVLPGHDYGPMTRRPLREEIQFNPFLQTEEEEEQFEEDAG